MSTDLADTLLARAPRGSEPVAILPVAAAELAPWLNKQEPEIRDWIAAVGFTAKPHSTCFVPGTGGALARVLVGIAEPLGPWALAGLPLTLAEGVYGLDPRFESQLTPADAALLTVGWAVGGYQFTRYKNRDREAAQLVVPAACDLAECQRVAQAVGIARDLINTPANDLGPDDLADAARSVADRFGATTRVVRGEALLDQNFPAIHAVGRASHRPPCLIDFTWGEVTAPRVTLVGKGICFDSGGLDLKPADNMLLMKKDMGGAAHALGLAHAVMDAGLPVRLRVLIAAAENSVGGDAFRPGDILATRNGKTVEVGNTDAEGRLVLCDALTLGDEDSPDLMVDIATLTGAARVALGTDVPALFTPDDALAEALCIQAEKLRDPLWRLPLWADYQNLLDSPVADTNNISPGAFGGAITAALFLAGFVEQAKAWAHVDMMAWNRSARPGRPVGGEALALRALYGYLATTYGR